MGFVIMHHINRLLTLTSTTMNRNPICECVEIVVWRLFHQLETSCFCVCHRNVVF